MDTKSKKWRAIVSFLAFFLGVSMLVGSLLSAASLLSRGSSALRDVQDAFENDYQDTSAFRRQMSEYLNDFLAMAVGGPVNYGYSYNDWIWERGTVVMQERVLWDWGGSDTSTTSEANEGDSEAAKEDYTAYAQRFHEQLKNDKNLLYTITHNNSLKYTNTDGLTLNGQTGEIPEGYNFLLYFDGEKVTAVKGEKSLDVYGDGIYQEENDWYVPGYRNFQADNETAKAIVCIAATEKPIIYVRGSYTDGQTDWQVNRLYYLAQG